MIGITLSADQVRAAPPEVRRWLEHELVGALGLAGGAVEHAVPPPVPQLAVITPEEAAEIFSRLRADYPACQVFFERAREAPNSLSADGMRAFSIAEIARHARL